MANAPGIRFTDGTTTVYISDGTAGWLTKYEAKSKAEDETEVTEQAKSLLIGGYSTVRGNVISLNKLFSQAKTYQREKTGACVYVERLMETAGSWFRSELVEALPIPEPSATDWGLVQGKLEISVVYTRKNWWEGAEAQLGLTNGNGTNNTSGLTVWNHDDATAGHDNWVSIAAADVAGDLMAPCRLEITVVGSTYDLYKFYIGQNFTDPDNFTHILESSGSADATCSGGAYISVTPGSTAETTIDTYTISAAQLAAAAGKWYLPIIRFNGSGGSPSRSGSYRFIFTSDGNTIWLQTGFYSFAALSAVANLGVMTPIRIPPGLATFSGLYDLALVLRVKGTTSAVKVDFVQLTPIDGFRKLDFIFPLSSRVIDSSISGETYMDNGAGANKTSYGTHYGEQIMLKPGTKQRLYFLAEESTLGVLSHSIEATMTVKVYYRPRYLTLN